MTFDYSKIDAVLSMELENPRDPNSKEINLFITTVAVPDSNQSAVLKQLGGVNGPEQQTTIFTARLSTNDIMALSNEPWVRRLAGSVQMRPCCGK